MSCNVFPNAFMILSWLIDSLVILSSTSVPGGPMMMTSSNVNTPLTAVTDLDFITCTLEELEVITATLVLSVIMTLSVSSTSLRLTFCVIKLPLTNGCSNTYTTPSFTPSFCLSISFNRYNILCDVEAEDRMYICVG